MCHLHTNKLSKSQRLLDSIAVAYFTATGSVAETSDGRFENLVYVQISRNQ